MWVRTRLIAYGTRPANPVITTGTTLQLKAWGRYSDGTDRDLTAESTFIGSPLVSVSNDPATRGLATGLAPGATSVSASYFDPIEGVTRLGSQELTVTDATLVSIAVTGAHPSIPQGARTQFEANGTYSDALVRDLTTQVSWSSSDANALVISNSAFQEGLARALLPGGSHTITASFAGVLGTRPLPGVERDPPERLDLVGRAAAARRGGGRPAVADRHRQLQRRRHPDPRRAELDLVGWDGGLGQRAVVRRRPRDRARPGKRRHLRQRHRRERLREPRGPILTRRL